MLWRKAIILLREDSVAELVGSLANSASYIFSSNPLCSSKRSMVSASKWASLCILFIQLIVPIVCPKCSGLLTRQVTVVRATCQEAELSGQVFAFKQSAQNLRANPKLVVLTNGTVCSDI